MRKLLLSLLLLLLPLTACAAQQTVHSTYLTEVTLPAVVSTKNLALFLSLCPQADPDTARCIIPREGFQWYIISGDVYADASGAAWYMDESGVHTLTDKPGWRLTSACPISPDHGDMTHLLFTRLSQSGTEICQLDLNTDEVTVLRRSREIIVLVLRHPLYSYNPLAALDWVLLCTAAISQPDPNSPAQQCRLLEVAGDTSFSGERYIANLRIPLLRWIILSDASAASAKSDFIQAYQHLYPDRTLQEERLTERTDLLDEPSFGRLYQEAYPGNIWLWRNGQATPLAPENTFTTGLCDAGLLDLNGDGVQELAYVYSTGSGICVEHARLYDPLKKQFTHLYSTMYTSPADALTLHINATGECQLLKGSEPVGRVTRYGLDVGLSLADFGHLVIDESTIEAVSAIIPGSPLLVTSYGGMMSLPLSDGTVLSLRFRGPEMLLTDISQSWRGLTLLDANATSLPDLSAPVDETQLLGLIALQAAPENYVEAGLLTTCQSAVDAYSGWTTYISFARTQTDLYQLLFTAQQPDGYLFQHAALPLNHDRAALAAIRPGMTLEEVQAISPGDAQYPFLFTGRTLPPSSVHVLPNGEVLMVKYEYSEGECVVTGTNWRWVTDMR